MTRQPVQSSNIVSIGYDAEQRAMEIEFVRGAVYRYDNVPAEEHAALISASSAGRYFAANIRGRYDGKKVEAEDETGALAVV